MNKIEWVDGFVNVFKGLGGAKDGNATTQLALSLGTTQLEAKELYGKNWLARRVIDVKVDDATREWRTFFDDTDERFTKAEKNYGTGSFKL